VLFRSNQWNIPASSLIQCYFYCILSFPHTMIRSSASLTADDVCIPCRVRRSPTCNTPEWDDLTLMVCTMRQWNPSTFKANKSDTFLHHDAPHDGPELILRVDGLQLWDTSQSNSTRINSFDKRKIWAELKRPENDVVEPVRIPCNDIQLCQGAEEMLFFTLKSGAYLEVSFSSRNAHDVLVAFLEAALPPERMERHCNVPTVDGCGTAESFDVEMLTASRMRERLQGESWREKARRKVTHVANRVAELSAAFSERACAPCYDEKSPVKEDVKKRESLPAPQFNFPDGLEESPEKVSNDLGHCQVPSGMSMENSEQEI